MRSPSYAPRINWKLRATQAVCSRSMLGRIEQPLTKLSLRVRETGATPPKVSTNSSQIQTKENRQNRIPRPHIRTIEFDYWSSITKYFEDHQQKKHSKMNGTMQQKPCHGEPAIHLHRIGKAHNSNCTDCNVQDTPLRQLAACIKHTVTREKSIQKHRKHIPAKRSNKQGCQSSLRV